MESRRDLEQRVADLEKQLAAYRGSGVARMRGVRKRSSWGIGDFPFYDIALGPDFERGELRGHAKGLIAIGDLATGFLALGGLSRGAIAVGGMAMGLLSFGGLSLGALVAVGGLAIGGAAFGGGAIGGVAMGGGAFGYYACGGGAAGVHAIDAIHRDPEAEAFFQEYGLMGFCRPKR
jgi:hypothetical protein